MSDSEWKPKYEEGLEFNTQVTIYTVDSDDPDYTYKLCIGEKVCDGWYNEEEVDEMILLGLPEGRLKKVRKEKEELEEKLREIEDQIKQLEEK